MIFNSLTFLVFLVLAVSLWWGLPRNSRLWMIFLASLIFYGFWRIEFLAVILFSTLIDYFISLELGKTPGERLKKRRLLLYLSLFCNLGLLIIFKYSFFISENAVMVFNSLGLNLDSPTFNIILPLGISFYTFQTISYTVDVYRGNIKPLSKFHLYGSYVLFFPQLVAGPILRVNEVTDQLDKRAVFSIDFIATGVKRILYGLFLKVVLADNIAPMVDEMYQVPANALGGLDVITMAFLFGFQIYFDFAGYSHIAIGCAKLMGISFPENFNFPYSANSLRSFWKRWHISLSSWIRDYLYLPLAGIRVKPTRSMSTGGLEIHQPERVSQHKKNKALFFTWAIMGFWHGANWTFLFWGCYHGLFIFLERQFGQRVKLPGILKNKFFGWSLTLLIIMLSWVSFRVQSISDLLTLYSALLDFDLYLNLSFSENSYLVTALLFLVVTGAYLVSEFALPFMMKYQKLMFALNVFKYTLIIVLVYIFFRPINQFIYFQF